LVLGNTAGAATVVALAGATRREFAVVRGGEVLRWLTIIQGRGKLALALAAAARVPDAPGDIAVEFAPAAKTPQPGAMGVELHRTTAHRWGWELLIDGRVVARQPSVLPLAGERSRLQAALDAFGAANVRVPRPATARQRRLLEALIPSVAEDPPARLVLTHSRERRRVDLCAEGLVVTAVRDDESQTRRAVWAEGPGPAASLVEGWSVAPDRVVHVATDEVAVFVAGFGAATVVGVGVEGRWTLRRVGEPGVGASALCDVLGLPRCDLQVIGVVSPDAVRLPWVSGGDFHHRDVLPAWVPREGYADRMAQAEAVRVWVGDGRIGALDPLDAVGWPAELVASLRRAVGSDGVTVASGVVGLEVRERWCVGQVERELSYLVTEPGPVRVRADDTGELVSEVCLDRAGHLAAAPRTCPYCGTPTCLACRDGAAPCDLCGVDVCGRCVPVGDTHRCGACASLAPVGRLRALFSRGVGRRAVAGEDALHRVVFVARTVGCRLVEIRRGRERHVRPLALTAQQAEALNRAAGANWFRAVETSV
jgi:hypothetical protein